MDKETLRRFCFTEAKEYKTENYCWIPKDLMDNGTIITKKGRIFSFNLTGFLVCRNDIYIVFPKNHYIPEEYDELLDHVQTLAGVLLRYQNDGSIEEEDNDLLGAMSGKVPEGIAAALWIIRDFVEYGYIQRQILRKVHTGNNIDWTRTIKTTDPLITSSSLIYAEPVYKKSSVDYNNMIYFLHKFAVQKSFQKFGWILGYNSYDVDPLMNDLPCNVEMAVYLLNKELNSTFNDREIKLLQTLIEFIKGSDRIDHKLTLDTLATNYFYNVWEAMCGFVFRNQYNQIKQYIPKPIWHLQNGEPKSTHQRPDILLAENRSVYVIDAKYYNVPSSLPGWYDLVKQFFYEYSLKHKFTSMFNALIFPDTVPEKIKFFGFVNMKGRPDLGKVEAFVVDTYSLMKDYANYRYSDWRQGIVNELSNKQPLSILGKKE